MKRLILPILTLVFATSVYAQDADKVATETRIAKQSATETGDRGLFTVPSVETLNKGQFSFGAGWSSFDRTPHALDISSLPVFLSYGLLGRLTVTATISPLSEIKAGTLSQAGSYSAYPFVTNSFAKGQGDTLLTGKFRLKRAKDNIGGISLRSFVKLATASNGKGLGTGATDVGADVIFTSALPLKFLMHSALGYTATKDAIDPVKGVKVGIKDQMRSGLGAAWPAAGLFNGSLQGIFEYSTVTFVGAGASNAASSVQNPSDVAAGVRVLMLNSGLTFHAGLRRNTKFDLTYNNGENGRNRTGFTFSISYTKPVHPPGNNRYPVVSLETSSDQIRVGGSATITATGYDADNDPLTYSWSATGGQIAGSGEKVTFNATGVNPGKYTIRATVSDGRGGTATSLIDVTVTQ